MDNQERAYAILTGWYTGDGMGSQTDGMERAEVEALCPQGIQEIYTLEEVRPLCGMTSDISDLPTLLALGIASNKACDVHHAKASYRKYIQEGEGPSDHLRHIIESEASKADHGLALSRTAIHGMLHSSIPQSKWLAFLKAETQITSSSELSLETAHLLSYGFSFLIEDECNDAVALVEELVLFAKRNTMDARIVTTLQTALNQKPLAYYDAKQSSFVLITLLKVMHTLIAFPSYEQGMEALVLSGGNARLTCALYGGFSAGLQGKESIPERWIDEVFPSFALEAMIKKQTLFKRETIHVEKLATSLAKSLLELA